MPARHHRSGGSPCRSLYQPAPAGLFEVGVLAMTLWDDVGGRTWIERAGPRTAVAEAVSRPRRRCTRVAARVVRRLVPPERPR